LGNLVVWLVQLCVLGSGVVFAAAVVVTHRRQQ